MTKDLTGMKFNRLSVLELANNEELGIKSGERYWKCLCDCGNITYVKTVNLTKGYIKSCGCLRTEKSAERFKNLDHSNRLIDLTGKRFGKLVVIKRAENKKGGTYWLCKCDCGKEVEVNARSLKDGTARSCHLKHKKSVPYEDLTGKKFGRLTVLSRDDYRVTKSGNKILMWKCLCDCGNITSVSTGNLKAGYTKSCGCLKEELINERWRKSKSES